MAQVSRRLRMTLPCDAQVLRECVLEQQMSPRAIAARYGISVARVRSALRALDLPILSSRSWEDLSAYALERYYANYQKSAAKRSHAFALSKEHFASLVGKPCAYCGRAPARKVGVCLFRGIDRIDSASGSIEGNVRPCCSTCNMAKRRMPEQAFIAWILCAADHLRAQGSAASPESTHSTDVEKER